jgi:hypothetical protein
MDKTAFPAGDTDPGDTADADRDTQRDTQPPPEPVGSGDTDEWLPL